MEDQQYIKGFNQGYLLKQHKTELYQTMTNGIVGDSPYKEGFLDGGKQFELERAQQQIKERMQKNRSKERDK